MNKIFEHYNQSGACNSWIEVFKTKKGFKVVRGNNNWNESNFTRFYTEIPEIPKSEESTEEFLNELYCFYHNLDAGKMYREICTYEGHN